MDVDLEAGVIHHLTMTLENLHANYVADAAPVLTVDSGDTIVASVPDVSWGLEAPTCTSAPRRKVAGRDAEANPERFAGPCLAGPIAIRDVRPGEAVEIAIERVVPGAWGWTYAGAGMGTPGWNESIGIGSAPLTLMRWEIDRGSRPERAGIAVSERGHKVPLRPFPGTIGLAPAPMPGRAHQSGWNPGPTGGNMDCRELVAGSTLFLPVALHGGMLSVGDGHAAQGDGEISGTAIECMLDELRFRVMRRRDLALRGPRIRTAPDELGRCRWVTPGFGETLDAAAAAATASMLDMLEERTGLTRAECAALSSAVVSLRITQTVNPLKGVHAVVDESAWS